MVRGFAGLLWRAANRFFDHNGPDRAAAIAFYTLLSLLPLLIFMISVGIALLGSFDVAYQGTLLLFRGVVVPLDERSLEALRNFVDIHELTAAVYARPEYITTLATSTPIAQHVRVDFELRGCPISKAQLLDTLLALLSGRRPNVPTYSVCMECKSRATPCVMVARGTPCLGPVTQAGCGALCPAYARGCYGCFGPMESPNTAALSEAWRALGASPPELLRAFRSFNAWAAPFRSASQSHEQRQE